MKIAVCGAGTATDQNTSANSATLGKELAKHEVLVLTGACNGYPLDVAKGVDALNGATLGISPAKDEAHHKEQYKFPIEPFSQIQYTGLGIPGRNLALVQEADAVIVIGGQIGTLNEYTLAFAMQKVIGVLEGSGGITLLLDEIAAKCEKNGERKNIVVDSEPANLVQKVVAKLKAKQAN